MIRMRALAKGKLGQEMVLELGLAISQDPTVGFASNLEGLQNKPQGICGPEIEVFGWLDYELIDALGDLCRLGLEKEGKVKEISS